jgi:predicted nuclease of predicted toxin-antitoxin system
VHLAELRLLGVTDQVVLSTAADQARILVSADTDFGSLLRSGRRTAPSLVLLRGAPSSAEQLGLLRATLVHNADQLVLGAVVVVRGNGEARVRRLPLD